MTERLLRVTCPPSARGNGYCAGAIFRRDDAGAWQCVRATPVLRWWLGHPTENIRRWLNSQAKRRGIVYE